MSGMIAKAKKALACGIKDESGQGALMAVLILLILGAFMIPALLSLMSTGLKAGQLHEEKTQRYYAADAGVEDALWQIKNDQLSILFPNPPAPPDGYDEYAYSDYNPLYRWDYDIFGGVNDRNVQVTIENAWIPKDISAPEPGEARDIIESGKLMVTGSVTAASEYQIKLTYYYDDDDPNGENLKVETIGIWLPPGFNYVAGSSNLEADPLDPYYSVPATEPYKSGETVVWNFNSVPFADFPGIDPTDSPMTTIITFQFTSNQPDQSPGAALSWIETTGVAGIDYTWDADVKIHKTSSVASDPATGKQTTVEAYTAEIKMRKLASAISGDYFAIGNTLMTATGTGEDRKYRDRLFKESSATVTEDDIPSNAMIEAAWLYWSGWIEGGEQTIWEDDCSNDDNWTMGSDWELYGWGDKEFRGHHESGGDRYLTMKPDIPDFPDLSEYLGETVTISWEQDESGWLDGSDCLKFQLSPDGGSSWGELIPAFCDDLGWGEETFVYEIPQGYLTSNCTMRFYLDGFDGTDWRGNPNQYAYIDNIRISVVAETGVEGAKVNRVIFNDNQITADEWQVEPTPDSGAPDSWSYRCYYDATDIVVAELDPDTMSGSFTLGHWLEDGEEEYDLYPTGTTGYPLATPASCTGYGCDRYQWTYAGWSLIVIYSSPETKGHQLYLFDDLHYVGAGGQPTEVPFSISGFLAPDDTAGSHLTYFVGEGDDHYTGDSIEVNGNYLSGSGNPWDNIFNSYSNAIDDPDPKSGIDIDTFDMSDYIAPGGTSAEVILVTRRGAGGVAEIYNLVYIILSFRSQVTIGGAISYLIVG